MQHGLNIETTLIATCSPCIPLQPSHQNRFEFRAVPHGRSSKGESEWGENGCYTIHTGGAQHRRAKGIPTASSSATTKKRKRAPPSTRRGPGNYRAGCGSVPSVSAASECSASMSSGSVANSQVCTERKLRVVYLWHMSRSALDGCCMRVKRRKAVLTCLLALESL